MGKYDGLTISPVLIEDSDSVLRRERIHGVVSFVMGSKRGRCLPGPCPLGKAIPIAAAALPISTERRRRSNPPQSSPVPSACSDSIAVGAILPRAFICLPIAWAADHMTMDARCPTSAEYEVGRGRS